MELLGDLSLEEKLDLAVWADENGFDDAWLAEISDPDAFVTLAVAATRTERIRVGTAIIPMGPRSVPMLASSATTVHEISNGRFVLGLGVSTKVIVEKWNAPGGCLGRTRETVDTCGRCSPVTAPTTGSSSHARLQARHPRGPPACAQTADVNARAGGEIADAVLLNAARRRGLKAIEPSATADAPGATAARLIMMVPWSHRDVDRARRAFAGAAWPSISARLLPEGAHLVSWVTVEEAPGGGDGRHRARPRDRRRAGGRDRRVRSPEHCGSASRTTGTRASGRWRSAPVENARGR